MNMTIIRLKSPGCCGSRLRDSCGRNYKNHHDDKTFGIAFKYVYNVTL